MADTYTVPYNLLKAEAGKQPWYAEMNTNLDTINDAMKANADGVAGNITDIGINAAAIVANAGDIDSHSVQHEDAGIDEISLTGLEGSQIKIGASNIQIDTLVEKTVDHGLDIELIHFEDQRITGLQTPVADDEPATFGLLKSTINNLDPQESIKDMIDFAAEPSTPAIGDRYIMNGTTGVGSISTLTTFTQWYIYELSLGIIDSTCDTNSTTTVTMDDTSVITAGQLVTGAGIPADTIVASITNNTTFELSQAATATASDVTLTFKDWTEIASNDGMYAWLEDEEKFYLYDLDAATWVPFGGFVTHNNLGGLQGGTSAEYYHLTASEHTEIAGWLNNVTLDTNGDASIGAITVNQNSDTVILSHDGTDGIITSSDGGLKLTTSEGTNTPYVLNVAGRGSGFGSINFDGATWLHAEGADNVFLGWVMAASITEAIAARNTGVGSGAFENITIGLDNTAIGMTALGGLTEGTENTCIGVSSGSSITTGDNNVCIGIGTGAMITTSDNTLIGSLAGTLLTGAGNVMLGYAAGAQVTAVSNKLYIANSNTTTPLIYGDFSAAELTINGILDVIGNTPGDVGGFAAGALQVTSPTVAEFAGATITGHNSYGGNKQLWYIGSTSTSTHDNVAFINRRNANLELHTNNLPRMTIQADGKVGIGIAAPTEKLDVVGNIKTNGNITDGTNAVTPAALKYKEYDFGGGGWDYPAANPADWEDYVLGTGTVRVHWFDPTTDEYLDAQIKAPKFLDTAGTVTFEAEVIHAAGSTSKNVVLEFHHSARATTENVNAAYVIESSGTKAVINTADFITLITWTETVSNLGWASDDFIRIKFARDADGTGGTDDLAEDAGLIHFRVLVPIL